MNLPELMNLFKEVADIRTRDTLDLKVPKLRDGNYKIISSEPDWYTKEVMEEFVARAERIHGGGVDPREDNFLKSRISQRSNSSHMMKAGVFNACTSDLMMMNLPR